MARSVLRGRMMKDLAEIIQKRTTPGVLIFDEEDCLLYSNPEALDIIPKLDEPSEQGTPCVPEQILELLRKVREKSAKNVGHSRIEQSCVFLQGEAGAPCSLRAFRIGQHAEAGRPTHTMVMVEKIAECHEPDFNKAGIQYNLSKREVEVMRLVYRGFSNKAISEKLFVSEHTAKDHVKNIIRKMDVSSRGEMIARIK